LKLSSSSLQKKSNPKKKKLKEHRHTHYLLRLFISKDWKKKDSGHTGRKSGKQPNQSILTSIAAFFAISRNRCFHCPFFALLCSNNIWNYLRTVDARVEFFDACICFSISGSLAWANDTGRAGWVQPKNVNKKYIIKIVYVKKYKYEFIVFHLYINVRVRIKIPI